MRVIAAAEAPVMPSNTRTLAPGRGDLRDAVAHRASADDGDDLDAIDRG